ncbi:Leucine Rich Repeat family protein [Trichomonas vaginalis G3]|uniref:Leucine Rich Repeat family protein n=1 Tax=Trichomonas vaginalis (strain ATCC PRA-98 / G3) TaxID=412133 RepID=A2D916_TRIV3|nr:uncharacterized protein TVAGG3_0529360 [Trichomonas vaginalis G3]EAY23042.1 Leucine Rich Repeat family protein [Trichomonas vaginalis G3]KAI5519011.1 ribonuclease inhibitor domain-containing protein [Trichomonas vaginalis G3]|eukprot:XP_001584028.1 hypothetical protein [Trichomonas vaginalis G3]
MSSSPNYVTILNLSRRDDAMERDKISFLRNDLFFDYSFLLELDLSNNNLHFLPLSISQCFLLERINISHNPIMIPPIVLFSLPEIRKHPENLRFGNNQKCTQKMVKQILSESSQLNQIVLNLTEPDGKITCISISPEITLHELFILTHPELSTIKDYIFIVRTVSEKYKLYLIPDLTPIAPYFYPDAKWSFELKYIPPTITPQILPLVKSYIIQQQEMHKEDMFLAQALRLLPNDNTPQEELQQLSKKLFESELLSSRHFNVYLDNGKKLDVGVTNDCVSVKSANSNNYTLFKQTSISFDCVNSIFLLVCGDLALKLNKESAASLLPLFAISIEKSQPRSKKEDPISELIAAADDATESITRETKMMNVREDQIDKLLQRLKEFTSSKIMFTANDQV